MRKIRLNAPQIVQKLQEKRLQDLKAQVLRTAEINTIIKNNPGTSARDLVRAKIIGEIGGRKASAPQARRGGCGGCGSRKG